MCAIRGRPAARSVRDAAPLAPRCALDLMGPVQARLGPQRWHFQHGPIDLIIGAHGDDEAVRESLVHAWARFATVLPELTGELALLRLPVAEPCRMQGPIARRMWRLRGARSRPLGRGLLGMAA